MQFDAVVASLDATFNAELMHLGACEQQVRDECSQAVAVAKERADEVQMKVRAEASQRLVRDAIQRLRMATIGMLDQCMEELNECVAQEGPLLGQYEAAVRQEVDLVIAMAKEKRA